MAHPKMFDDADPILARVRGLALAFPDAQEKVSHGRPVFYTRKIFAYYGGSVRLDGEWIPHDQALIIRPDDADRPALAAQPNAFVPAYLGPAGWLGIDLDAATDWAEVAELLDASFRITAPRGSIRQLEAMVDWQRPS